MTVVYNNASFISMNEESVIYSVMVVSGKKIVYVGYNTPICYEDAKVVDLKGKYVIPLINDMVFFDISHARCRVLEAGQQADFIVLDRNILTESYPQILEVYKKGKKKI